MSEIPQIEYSTIDIASDELDLVLRTALGTETPAAVSPLAGGFSNTLLRIDLPDSTDSFVLRLYRQGERIASIEVALLERLASRVPVPEVVFADTHGTLIGRPLAVTRYVEGVLLDRIFTGGSSDDVIGAGKAVGEVLAAIGRVKFDHGGFFVGPHLVPNPETAVRGADLVPFVHDHLFQGPGQAALDADIRERFWNLVQQAAPQLSVIDGARSLVHADFNGKNILMQERGGSWTVSAVLDWEFALSSTPLFDIGNMLRFVDRMPPAFQPAFIDAFSVSGGTLPPNWAEVARLLDVFPLCQFLTFGPNTPFFDQIRDIISAKVQRGAV